MDFGIAVATSTNSWEVVKRAEELGFSHAWFYDTQLLCADVYAVMALAAHHTSRIKLATGVAVPSNRIAPVVASALATLNELAPGRVEFGIGTGYTARRTMGLNAVPLKAMTEYVHQVYGLLAGDTVSLGIEAKKRKIRLLSTADGLINTADPIPLHMSAMGPRARDVCADLDAGWVNFISEAHGAKGDLEDMQRAWAAANRLPDALHSTAFVLGAVLDEGEAFDSPRAMAQAGPWVAVVFHGLVEAEERGGVIPLPEVMAGTLEEYKALYATYRPEDARYLSLHAGHLVRVRDDERHLITGDLIRDLTFSGTKAQIRDKLAAVRDAGYSQVAIQIVQGQEHAVEAWADVIDGF
jgi:5,10-methylenetetrahydromethanopterin reductase